MQSGDEMPIQVPADVKGFDSLKVGSKVDVDYYRSMAVSLAPTGSKPTVNERKGRMIDEGGGVRGREVTISAEVVSVDQDAKTVTFKGPKGNLRTINVQNPALQEKLPSLKPGQVVQFDFVEAVAASIQPAAE
jgi:cold shock CspA family protein